MLTESEDAAALALCPRQGGALLSLQNYYIT